MLEQFVTQTMKRYFNFYQENIITNFYDYFKSLTYIDVITDVKVTTLRLFDILIFGCYGRHSSARGNYYFEGFQNYSSLDTVLNENSVQNVYIILD